MKLERSVNEPQLFKKLPDFFANPDTILIELAQNAQRAGASHLAMSIENEMLSAYDNGRGCANPEALFVLASSDWSDEVESMHNPAGWGGMFLICISRTVTYRSRFGSITFDCEQYLNSADYRADILSLVDPADSVEGFSVEAALKTDVAARLLQGRSALRFFPLDVTINGERIERTTLVRVAGGHISDVLHLTYQGNDLCIVVSPSLATDLKGFVGDVAVVWYGIPVNVDTTGRKYVFLDVTTGTPLTPILPIRTGVKEDDKLSALFQFVRDNLVQHCIAYINDDSRAEKTALQCRFEIMSQFATQEELDSLDRFSVSLSEPHHDHDNYYPSRRREVVRRSEPLPVSEVVRSFSVAGHPEINSETVIDWGLVLPSEIIVAVEAAERRPSWVQIEERGYDIVVTPRVEYPFDLNYDWAHADISCAGKQIDCLSVITGWRDGLIVYTHAPADIYHLLQAIFERHLYSDDMESDSYDSQRASFEDGDIDEDISRITGTFSKSALLDGFRVAGVAISDILGITVRRKTLVLKLRKGKTMTLKLAA